MTEKGKNVSDTIDLKQTHLLAAAKKLADTLYQWNVVDLPELVIDRARGGGTPYYHVNQALGAVLRLLGTQNQMGFYEGIASGMHPLDALENAKKYEMEA